MINETKEKNKKVFLGVGLVLAVVMIGAWTIWSTRQQLEVYEVADAPVNQAPMPRLSMVYSDAMSDGLSIGDEIQVDVVVDYHLGLDFGAPKGVDAVVKYDVTKIKPLVIENGDMFASLAKVNILHKEGEIRVSGLQTDSDTLPTIGDGGSAMTQVLAKIKYEVVSEGQTAIELGFDGAGVTTDSNVVFQEDYMEDNNIVLADMLKSVTPLELELTVEPVLAGEGEDCGGPDGTICQDGLMCELVVGDGGDMTGTSICVRTGGGPTHCETDADCPAETPYCRATPWGGCPVITDENGLEAQTDCAHEPRCYPPESAASPTPTPSPTPSLTPSPIPIPEPVVERAKLSLTIADSRIGATAGVLYGVQQYEQGQERDDEEVIVNLGHFVTDESGVALVQLPALVNRRLKLYVQTYNSLVRSMLRTVSVPAPHRVCSAGMKQTNTGEWEETVECSYVVSSTPLLATFDNLVLGDVYSPQDNVVNSFDALDVIYHLGDTESYVHGNSNGMIALTSKYDLNGDGIVNARDLKIVMDNFGVTGEEIVE